MSTGHDRPSGSLRPESAPENRSAFQLSPRGPLGPDPLSEVLRSVRLTGALFFLVDARAPWVAPAPSAAILAPILLPAAEQIVSYHIVTEGRCWASVAGAPPLALDAGDVLLVPHGDPYVLSNPPGITADGASEESLAFFRRMSRGELPSIVTEGGDGPERIRIVCGFLGCDVRPFNPALASLPRVVRCGRGERGAEDRLAPLIDFAISESREARSGGQCVLLRLSELLFVEVVRRCLSTVEAAPTGWLAGLRDPQVGRVLAELHGRPAAAWTLESLARTVGTSRSTLAERFTALVGQPPMHYLAHWRMQLATRLLDDHAAKVAAVAADVGYESEAAFSRAFKKIVGMPPAAWRTRAASTAGSLASSGETRYGNRIFAGTEDSWPSTSRSEITSRSSR